MSTTRYARQLTLNHSGFGRPTNAWIGSASSMHLTMSADVSLWFVERRIRAQIHYASAHNNVVFIFLVESLASTRSRLNDRSAVVENINILDGDGSYHHMGKFKYLLNTVSDDQRARVYIGDMAGLPTWISACFI
jgi:hypothetical protein